MIPMFTIVSTLITLGVTGALVWVLYRINLPMLRAERDGADGADNAANEGGGE
jgi:hypothetical protein